MRIPAKTSSDSEWNANDISAELDRLLRQISDCLEDRQSRVESLQQGSEKTCCVSGRLTAYSSDRRCDSHVRVHRSLIDHLESEGDARPRASLVSILRGRFRTGRSHRRAGSGGQAVGLQLCLVSGRIPSGLGRPPQSLLAADAQRRRWRFLSGSVT